MKHIYSSKEFEELIGRSANTVQMWDRKGILEAHWMSSKRRSYTHDQYSAYLGLKAKDQGKTIVYARVSGPAQKKDLVD